MEEKFRLTFEGEAQDLVKQIDDVTKKLNKTRDLTTKWNKERSQLAREERREAFNALSIEERKVRLTKQQLDLERHLARARSQGNTLRATALGVSLARNRSAMRGLGGGDSSSTSDGFIGGVIASRLGPAALAGAVAAAARSALRFADETSDLADQLGVTKAQIVQITRAAGYAGASQGTVLGNLSSLSAARSAALGGDERSQALFSRFGVDPSKGNIIELAQSIANALGPGGMQAGDRSAIGSLFGRRPEGIIATLNNLPDIDPSIEQDLERLDRVNTKIEEFYNSLKTTAASLFANGIETLSLWKEFFSLPFKQTLEKPVNFADKRRAEDTFIRPSIQGTQQYEDPYRRSAVPQADALARMGLYIGGGPNNPSNIMRQQLSELKAIREATKSQTVAIKDW